MFRLSLLALAGCVLVVFSGCVSTPRTRINKNPVLFQNLSPEQRQLVSAGRISEGMKRDAVYLAWGRPSIIRVGQRSGVDTEFWQYTRLETTIVDTPPIPTRFVDRRGRVYADYYYPMRPTFVHERVPGRWVLFKEGLVEEWSLPIRY